MMRSATDLMSVETPAWPEVKAAIEAAPYPVRALPVDPEQGAEVIERLQVTPASALGALAANCGGLLVDHGWLRILGGGYRGPGAASQAPAVQLGAASQAPAGQPGAAGQLADLATVNGLPARGDGPPEHPPGYLVVAVDVLGGQFAIDGGALGLAPGKVCYFAPDSLTWGNTDAGHSRFVQAMLGGATTQFYESFRWPGWESECDALALDQGWSLYPPPFTAEGKDLTQVARRTVPMAELLDFYTDAASQLNA